MTRNATCGIAWASKGLLLAGCLLSAGLCSPAAADTFTWTGQAGSNGWYSTALIPGSSPPEYINNFGRTPPVWPGETDDAIVGAVASISDGHVAVLNLTDGGTIGTSGGYTLRVLQNLLNSGTLNVHGGDASTPIVRFGQTLTNTATGVVDVHVGGVLVAEGDSIVNDGAIWLNTNTGMGDGRLRLDNDVAISGTGTLHCGSDIYSLTGRTLTNSVNHTIAYGAGSIRTALINNGTVNANRASQPIYLRDEPKTNNNLLRASSNATLGVYTAINQAAAGRIVADGGTVALDNCSIEGGTLDTTGTSKIQISASRTASIRNLVNKGYLWAPNNGSTLALGGSYVTNNGTIQLTLSTGMGNGQMRIDSDVLLDGSGQLLCAAPVYSDSGKTLTNGPAHRIHSGKGTISAGVINQGTLDSDWPGQAIALTGTAKTNNNLMRASNGGYLDIYTTITQGTAGRIVADGGTVRLRGGGIQGGTTSTAGSSSFEAASGTTTTLADLTNDGYILVPNNASTLAIAGTTITNNGTIELRASTGAGHGLMRLDADVSFGGTGVIQPKSYIFTSTGKRLTNLAGHTIAGTGGINVDCLNRGAIRANGGGTLTINPQSAGSVNEGIIEVVAGNTLTINSANLFVQQAGCILAGDDLNVSGGPLSIQGGSLYGIGPVNGNVSNAAGQIEPGNSPGTLRINGTFTQGASGRLCIDLAGVAAGEFDVLQATGTATLNGELHLRAISEYVPPAGTEFTILTCGSRSGTFSNVTGSGQYQVTYSPTSVTIKVLVPPDPGDINGDGGVDVVDLLYLVEAFGTLLGDPLYNPDCDLNGDGSIDVVDLLILVDFWPA
jgi:hypothetical protein